MVKRKKRLGKFSGMPKNPWFRKRTNKDSWGIVPINYKGRLSFAILIFINIFSAWSLDIMNASWKEVNKFLVVFLLSLFVFIEVAKNNTKGLRRGR